MLSIVIPVGPGDDAYHDLLQCLAGFPAPCEIVLSTCRPLLADWPEPDANRLVQVSGPAGRAGQLNRGIRAASARCLWLMHADNRPDAATMAAAAEFARECGTPDGPMKLGWFALAFVPGGPRLAMLNAAGANWRSRLFRLPFGDQAWLMNREAFEHIGGFDETFGRGEDLDFILRARRAGIRLCRLQPAIRTSARRYHEQGWLRTTLAHLWLTLRLWLKSTRRSRQTPL